MAALLAAPNTWAQSCVSPSFERSAQPHGAWLPLSAACWVEWTTAPAQESSDPLRSEPAARAALRAETSPAAFDPEAAAPGEVIDTRDLPSARLNGGIEPAAPRSVFGMRGSEVFQMRPAALPAGEESRAVYAWVSKMTGERSLGRERDAHHASPIRTPGGPFVQVLALLVLGVMLLRRQWTR